MVEESLSHLRYTAGRGCGMYVAKCFLPVCLPTGNPP